MKILLKIFRYDQIMYSKIIHGEKTLIQLDLWKNHENPRNWVGIICTNLGSFWELVGG